MGHGDLYTRFNLFTCIFLSFLAIFTAKVSTQESYVDADGFFHGNDILETNQHYGEDLFSTYLALDL